MAAAPFTAEAVARALAAPVARVEVVERFAASAAEVARLRVWSADGRPSRTVIAKAASGAGLAAARREQRFYDRLAPRWDHPAPALLGVAEDGDGDAALLLLITEDLGAAGYAIAASGVTEVQLAGVVDTLVSQHARFWDDPELARLEGDPASVTRACQALPVEVIAGHAIAVRAAAADFAVTEATRLTPAERTLLEDVVAVWERQLVARVAAGAVTLIHGDFHLLGNIFFAPAAPRPRVIDWSEAKAGLGPHDLAYCLFAAPADDRAARDMRLLRRYWTGLVAAGVTDYGWALCQWDLRFSVLTNLFQAVFQRSLYWFQRTAAVAAALGCGHALHVPPPVG